MMYHINRSAGVVVCKMERNDKYGDHSSPQDEAISFLVDRAIRQLTGKMSGFDDWRLMSIKDGITQMAKFCVWKYVNNSYMGKAVCSEQDTWDEDYGMQLAKERCLSKYWYDVYQAGDALGTMFYNLSYDIDDRTDEADCRVIHLDDSIDDKAGTVTKE